MSEQAKRSAVIKGLVEAMPRLPRDRKQEADQIRVKKRLFDAMSRIPRDSA